MTIKYLLYFVAVTTMMLISGCNSSSIKWIGQVTPGDYRGGYDFSIGGPSAHVAIQLTINNDGSFDLRETWKGGGCHEGTRAYTGTLQLHEEMYNGAKKSWYILYGSNPGLDIHAKYSLSENLELRDDINNTYQSYSTAKKRCTLHK